MASQRAGAVALLRLERSRASTSPQTSTHSSAMIISDRFVVNPFSTWGRLSVNRAQFRKVSKNCSTAAWPLCQEMTGTFVGSPPKYLL